MSWSNRDPHCIGKTNRSLKSKGAFVVGQGKRMKSENGILVILGTPLNSASHLDDIMQF